MISYNTVTLQNGLRIIHTQNSSDVIYCGYAIDAGTRDEEENEQGMAHFVEHLVFKGTKKRHAWHILNRMENVGGDLNAYTNKEETVIYCAHLVKDFQRAAELLTDITFNSTFPQKEIDKEVEVILDEIQSYKDDPSELIFDDFEELLFPNHSLGRNILGKRDMLKKFTTNDALSFTSRFYKASNMVFFVQGNINFKKVVRTMERITSDVPLIETNKKRNSPLAYVPTNTIIHKRTHQAHVIIGSRAYNAYNPKRSSLYLLNNILGGPGMNSRLNVALRERRGLVYNVEANLTSYTDTGVFSIYFGTDQHDVDKCLSLVYKELKNLREKRLTSMQLSSAKKQIIGQIGVGGDDYENNALDMAKIFLHYNKYENNSQTYKRIEAITSESLMEVANEMFSEENLSSLIYRE